MGRTGYSKEKQNTKEKQNGGERDEAEEVQYLSLGTASPRNHRATKKNKGRMPSCMEGLWNGQVRPHYGVRTACVQVMIPCI